MAGSLNGKVALITGGSSGIGRTTAVRFAKEGAKVVVADVLEENGEQAVRQIQQSGGEAIYLKCDVSRAEDVEATINSIVELYGRLDCAFNNAGIAGDVAYLADCTEENWDRVININLKGVWLCMKYEIRQMLAQGSGVIVNMSSVSGLVGDPEHPAYGASKHGVAGLTKAAALAYARSNIRINAVCPAAIRTGMIERTIQIHPDMSWESLAEDHPIGRIGEPEDVASAVLWLCTEESGFITGHLLVLDGGMTV